MPPTEDELRELRQGYLDTTRETLKTLRQHASSLSRNGQFKSSFPVLLYLAHQLKGSGGTLGFDGITAAAVELAEELEKFLDDAVERPAPDELSTRVNEVLDRLQAALEEGDRELASGA